MKKLILILMAAFSLMAVALEQEPCEQWDDIDTNLSLPNEIEGMYMLKRWVYGKNDQSFYYETREFAAGSVGQRMLTVYLYDRDWAKLKADGICEDVRRELADVVKGGRLRSDGEFTNIVVRKTGVHGKIGAMDYLAAEFTYRDGRRGSDMRGWALVTSFAGRFLKLRYSEYVADVNGKPSPTRWPEIVEKVGTLMDRARQDRLIDVYAFSNPFDRLAVIRRKWVGADNRVSMWKKPNFGEKFLEINRVEHWCNDKPEERYQVFEQYVREAIGLRIDPATWYYNLACALAVQKKTDASIEALEQAVAAGLGTCNESAHIGQDPDMHSLTNDMRFAALCEAMNVDARPSVEGPQRVAEEKDGFVRLSNENVYFALEDAAYLVNLSTSNECPVVYVNHHVKHDTIPCDGLVNVVYPKEAHDERRGVAFADISFLNFDRSHRLKEPNYCPTVVASNWAYGDDWLNGTTSIPAGYGVSEANATRECQLQVERNVLGIYTAADDYRKDGVDRFFGWFPGCITYAGGPEEADKFVVLFRDIVRALPKPFRASAALLAPNLIRYGQKCVKTEVDFMSGKAQRPVLRFADIDVEKVLERAAQMLTNAPLPVMAFLDGEKTRALSKSMLWDFWDDPYDKACRGRSPYHATFFACNAERTFRAAVAVEPEKTGKFVWKVLQGDEKKVRIVPKTGDMREIELEVDCHTAFEVTLAEGTKQKTSRVDVGCFLVQTNGVASVPTIVSVFFSPNDVREYGQGGRLVSIDYTKRHIERYCPTHCPKGDWKDVFHWTDDGQLSGWTRTYADRSGCVMTNEFTRDGFIVDTRDALGRPKDVHRSLRATWMQMLEPTNMVGTTAAKMLDWYAYRHDYQNYNLENGTLAWQYTYENDADKFGKLSPKPYRPFRHRPELCRRADFKDSGFRLPLVNQLNLGYEIYRGYKHDRPNENLGDKVRVDSGIALKNEGLTPPKVLKKMKFSPWTPSSNDVWKVDVEEIEKKVAEDLWELADGSYRYYRPGTEGEEGTGVSVGWTYRNVNRAVERATYKELDKLYRRCDFNEAKKLFNDGFKDYWGRMLIVEGDYVEEEDLPKEKDWTLAAWRLSKDYCLGVFCDRHNGQQVRLYCLAQIEQETGSAWTLGDFRELPSRAMGNTVLRSATNDPVAWNNYAVLLYAEIANPQNYDEEKVAALLEKAARAGNATAFDNLDVLHENRGK